VSDPITLVYDQAVDLASAIEQAIGPKNRGNFDHNITRDLFRPRGAGIMEVQVQVVGFTQADIDSGEDPVQCLARRGYENLGNTWDLAFLLHRCPAEVKKWTWVYALGHDSRWASSHETTYVPVAWADYQYCSFRLDPLSDILVPSGVIVIC